MSTHTQRNHEADLVLTEIEQMGRKHRFILNSAQPKHIETHEADLVAIETMNVSTQAFIQNSSNFAPQCTEHPCMVLCLLQRPSERSPMPVPVSADRPQPIGDVVLSAPGRATSCHIPSADFLLQQIRSVNSSTSPGNVLAPCPAASTMKKTTRLLCVSSLPSWSDTGTTIMAIRMVVTGAAASTGTKLTPM